MLLLILGAAIAVCGWVGYTIIVYGCRARLTDESLHEDLELVGRYYDVQRIVQVDKLAYSHSSVARYYGKTTLRDYWLLELFTGPGMHTKFSHGVGQLELVLREIAKCNAQSVLDVGCGRGYGTACLARQMPNASFFGIDLVPRHIVAARLSGCDNAAFVQGEAVRFLSSTLTKFDVVYGLESMCHMDTLSKMRAFLWRCKQAMEQTGRLIIVDGFRSAAFDTAPAEQQMAMALAECGFRIQRMPAKADWITEARRLGFCLLGNVDLTAHAAPFWARGWRVARVLLRLGLSRLLPAESAANLLAVTTVAHAMRDRSAAEYGMLVFGAA